MSTGRVRRVLVGRASPVFRSACFVMWIFELEVDVAAHHPVLIVPAARKAAAVGWALGSLPHDRPKRLLERGRR
jgi:hypothetical protein